MARPRSDTGSLAKEPHSLSLKVLRLSKPSFAQQRPVAPDNIAKIPRPAGSALPVDGADHDFLLSPILSLPPAFGSAYVGETFSCSLCANNELRKDGAPRIVSDVKITADMQTPSQQSIALLVTGDGSGTDAQLPPEASMQRIVQYDLKEEGVHVLAVNLTYRESIAGENITPSGRLRSFRKLYQFQAQPCLSVRTKATELAPKEIPDKSLGPYGRTQLVRYVLEAQLENVADGSLALEQTRLLPQPPFTASSLNWDMNGSKEDGPLLNPRDVMQLAFLIEQQPDNSEGLEELRANLKRDGRSALGQIALEWRSAMGERGQLTTGTLYSRRRA